MFMSCLDLSVEPHICRSKGGQKYLSWISNRKFKFSILQNNSPALKPALLSVVCILIKISFSCLSCLRQLQSFSSQIKIFGGHLGLLSVSHIPYSMAGHYIGPTFKVDSEFDHSCHLRCNHCDPNTLHLSSRLL